MFDSTVYKSAGSCLRFYCEPSKGAGFELKILQSSLTRVKFVW